MFLYLGCWHYYNTHHPPRACAPRAGVRRAGVRRTAARNRESPDAIESVRGVGRVASEGEGGMGGGEGGGSGYRYRRSGRAGGRARVRRHPSARPLQRAPSTPCDSSVQDATRIMQLAARNTRDPPRLRPQATQRDARQRPATLQRASGTAGRSRHQRSGRHGGLSCAAAERRAACAKGRRSVRIKQACRGTPVWVGAPREYPSEYPGEYSCECPW